ncbi:MAG TPA: acetolactate decarboxylase [Bacillota bacterium]|nr:acetolactate decarboxylase [Bacillota bacterium]
MKGLRYVFLLVLIVVMAASVSFGASADKDVIYQISTLGALQEGVYDGVATMKELKKHGDFGIGTFEGLDGELTELNGKFYQIKADGKVYQVADTIKTPFAAVTYFETDKKVALDQPMDFKQLQDYFQSQLPSPNIPYAVKITGSFTYVKTRSVPKQSKPYPRLVEVTKNQPTFEMKDVTGTILGYWLPQYLAGVNMAGYHFHFLTDDKQGGGHLLEIQLTKGTLELDYTYGLELVLPSQSDFFKTDLSGDKTKELESIEK